MRLDDICVKEQIYRVVDNVSMVQLQTFLMKVAIGKCGDNAGILFPVWSRVINWYRKYGWCRCALCFTDAGVYLNRLFPGGVNYLVDMTIDENYEDITLSLLDTVDKECCVYTDIRMDDIESVHEIMSVTGTWVECDHAWAGDKREMQSFLMKQAVEVCDNKSWQFMDTYSQIENIVFGYTPDSNIPNNERHILTFSDEGIYFSSSDVIHVGNNMKIYAFDCELDMSKNLIVTLSEVILNTLD